MQLNDIDFAIIRFFSEDGSMQSACYIQKFLEKELKRKMWYYNIRTHCEKLVSLNFLRRHAEKKGTYYTLNENYAVAVNGTVFVQRDEHGKACPMYCQFFSPKSCSLWNSLPKEIQKRMKRIMMLKNENTEKIKSD